MNYNTKHGEVNHMTQEEIDLARARLKLPMHVEDAEVAKRVEDTLLLTIIRMKLAWDRLVHALAGPTEPIAFPQANGHLHGNSETRDLPVCRPKENLVVSCWHIPLWKRVKLLWTCNVWLVVKGTTQPPLWIDTEVNWK